MAPIIPFTQEIPVDPPDNEESTQNSVHIMSDSDSLSEDEDHHGYQPLSQDPENNILDNHSDVDEESNFLSDDDMMTAGPSEINHQVLLLPAPQLDKIDIVDKFQPKKDLKMDEEHIETIKSVMKGITLPKSNLPQWAHLVPEEEWKAALLSDMLSRNSSGKSFLGANSTQLDDDVTR